MGTEFVMKCNDCSEEFSYREGGGRDFYLFHCEQCGKEKTMTYDELRHGIREDLPTLQDVINRGLDPCILCRGKVSLNSIKRCPKCKSTSVEEKVTGGRVTRSHYD